ncbi:MAG TPA: ATP-binding protein [Coleofasciculaceae cyanobacterium]
MIPKSVPSEPQRSWKSWISWVTRRTSITYKISCGYALTLGVAILGTTAGFAIGNYYQHQAKLREQDALEEIHDIHRLQTNLLLTQSHQQHFTNSTPNLEHLREDLSHFLTHLVNFNQAWSEFKSSYDYRGNVTLQESIAEMQMFQQIVQNYDSSLKEYNQQTKGLLEAIDSPNLKPEEIKAAQQQFLNLQKSTWHPKLESFINDLAALNDIVNAEYTQASAYRLTADALRVKIMACSILLSVALAITLAIYTSRAIARPIKATTKIAQQVTQEKNFGLQAPVTTQDEIGTLTFSLNQLIQQVNQLLEEQKAANQTQLIQSEKMSSLGRMIAGVAHEISDPVNFVYGNSLYACEYVQDLLTLLETYTNQIPNPPQALQVQLEEIDIEFIKEDLPKVLNSMKLGAERTTKVIYSLKDFSHLDEAIAHPVDLHACIDSTLLILNNRMQDITVIRNYSDIPEIEGFAGLLYQVFMNLLSNAIDALEESENNKLIAISTTLQNKDWVVVKIADNGSGICVENQAKIFNAFFTTKPPGVGTALGLAISHQVIVEKHGGKITCKSEVGIGTEFAIALPIKHQPGVTSSDNTLLATSVTGECYGTGLGGCKG